MVILPIGGHVGNNKGSHNPYYQRFNAWKQALAQGKPAPVK